MSIVKVYGFGDNKKIKVVYMPVCRNAGIVDDSDSLDMSSSVCRSGVGDGKLEESILRAKSRIFELAYCNPWTLFFTATLSKAHYDRTNLEKFHRDIVVFIRNYNRRFNLNIKFLLIPELHSDGKSWHMHGFLFGLPEDHLKQFQIGDKMPKAIRDKVFAGEVVFRWIPYEEQFGWNDLEPIRNHEAVSKYVTKYISKGLAHSVTEFNAHMYYHSRGLRFAEVIKKGYMSTAIDIKPESEFHGDHCSVYWYPFDTHSLSLISNCIV